MDKAFDAILQSEVDALDVARTSYCFFGEQFRYQCLCCSEEVYLAAADSNEKSPHFRHRRGNNDTECERYLGQLSAEEYFELWRKHKREYIEFYFNRDKMTFEVCTSFTEEELHVHEKENHNITISLKYFGEPFFSIPISKRVFIPCVKSYFTIPEFSTKYFISFNSGIKPCTYNDVMRNSEKINIFRVGKQDEHCKHQTSSFIYTDTQYIGICEKEEALQELVSLKYVHSKEPFSFSTQNKVFYGLEFLVKEAEFSVLSFFQKHDYQLNTSETFSILWPPVYTRDSCSICTRDTVYVFSSFELIPHGNINVDDMFARKISRDILKIQMNDEVIVHEKNIDICIRKERELGIETDPEEPVTRYSERYTVSDQYDYYLFDQNGCTRLIPGIIVYLSQSDRIVGYKSGHIKEIVCACVKEKIDTRLLINDILKYHPQSETFEMDDFMDITTDKTILSYLEDCYKSGRINTVVKRYIKEGMI